MHRNIGRVASVSVLVAISGCGFEAQDYSASDTGEHAAQESSARDLAEAEQELHSVSSSRYWPKNGPFENYQIHVCIPECQASSFPDDPQICADAQAATRRMLATSFQRYTRLNFIFDEDCLGKGRNLGKMRILLTWDGAGGRTYQSYRDSNDVFQEQGALGYRADREMNISSERSVEVVAHEVGHSLGFHHEYLRGDNGDKTCIHRGEDITLGADTNGTKLTPYYDEFSIMNETYCRPGFDGLSSGDILGLRTAYGRMWSGSVVNAGTGMCLTNWMEAEPGKAKTLVQNCTGAAYMTWRYGDNTTWEGLSLRSLKEGRTRDILETTSSSWEAQVSQDDTPNADNERWNFRDMEIVGPGNLCLTVSNSPTNGENTKLQYCTGAAGQKWTMAESARDKFYTIKSAANANLCLRATSTSGAGVFEVVTCTSGSQHLREVGLGYGTQALQVTNSSGGSPVCADVDTSKQVAGQEVMAKSCSPSSRQEWFLRGELQSVSTGECLFANTSTRMISMEACGNADQRWEYYP